MSHPRDPRSRISAALYSISTTTHSCTGQAVHLASQRAQHGLAEQILADKAATDCVPLHCKEMGRKQRGNSSKDTLKEDEQVYVTVVSLLDLSLRNDVIEMTDQAREASHMVLLAMCIKDKAAAEAYYRRLLNKCRDLDSILELDTSIDFASQPAWIKYCKECLNLVVLREILYDQPLVPLELTVKKIKRKIYLRKESLQHFDRDQLCELEISDVVGRYRAVERTCKELLDVFDMAEKSLLESLSSKAIVSEYYRQVARCRELDEVVHDTWRNRATKAKEWKEFCTTCHIAQWYHCTLHDKMLMLYSIEKRSGGIPYLPGGKMQFGLKELLEALPHEYNECLQQSNEGPASSMPPPTSEIAPGANVLPVTGYFCIVRDKLVHVRDEAAMGLKGKHSSEWEPKHPNVLVCQLKPDHHVVIDMPRVLKKTTSTLAVSMETAISWHDCAYEIFLKGSRHYAVSMYEEYMENVLATDTEQLSSQFKIGIPNTGERMAMYMLQSMTMIWFRQFLYGTPFPVMLPEEMLPVVQPHLSKHGIKVDVHPTA